MNLVKRLGPRNGGTDLFPSIAPLSTLQRRIDRLFGEPWGDFLAGDIAHPEELAFWPAIDVKEDEKLLTLKADIPGVDPKDIDVQITDRMLTISGKREQEIDETKKGMRYFERRFGTFRRVFELPDFIDAAKIEAKCDKGVLTVMLPKLPGQSPKHVAVKTMTT